MIEDKLKTDREKLEQAILALEDSRANLGDAVVDAAQLSLRESLSTIERAERTIQQRKFATVLFMDIVGSTSMIKDLDPEENLTIMDTALMRLAEPVHAHGGRVTRFMGDGFKALFGAPVARENDPEMAVKAGLQILKEAQNYAQEVKSQWHLQEFNVRVGISTGLVIVGGDTEAQNTIMGATVNLAARLEQAAKPGTLLISDHTYKHVRGLFDLQLLDPITAKGFTVPIQVYQVDRAKPQGFSISNQSVAGIETRMVAREAEMLMLQNLYRDATEDAEVHVVTVIGEAGVGKSRLLFEFSRWLERLPEQTTQFYGRATPEMETVPYGLFRRVFANRFEILDSDTASEVRAKFRDGMSTVLNSDQADLVGQLLGIDFTSSQAVQNRLGTDSFGEMAAANLTKYLLATASKPTVIFFEDIHWADDSSLDLLDYLLTVLPETHLLVVCFSRPSLNDRRPSWGEGQDIHTRIDLKPLSRRGSRALVGEIMRKVREMPVDLRDLIVGRAEGNPFYVEELIKTLIEDGVIVQEKDYWRIELDHLEVARVPPTLTGILQARLDCLPREQIILLRRASVVGRLFWAALVAELASDEIEITEVGELLDDIRNRELIFQREHSTFKATNEYIFSNSAFRDTTYETVLVKQRREYHAQVAKWLEINAGERIGEYLSLIARHYELAGDAEKAVKYQQRLGEEALQVSAFRDAVRAFEKALALSQVISDADQEADGAATSAKLAEQAMLLVNLGNLYNRTGDYVRAADYLERGLTLACEVNAQQVEIAALNRLAQVASERGEYDAAQRHLDKVLALAREQDDLECMASTLSMLSTIAWKWGDIEQAEKCCHESLAIHRELGDQKKISLMFNILGILATLQENFDQAEQYYEQGLTMAREVDDRQLVADLLSNLGYLNHHSIKNFEKAERCFQESLLIAREINHRSGVASTLINLGQLQIFMGDVQVAEQNLNEALAESIAIGAVPLTLDALVGVAKRQIVVGEIDSAAELVGLVLAHPASEMDSKQLAEAALGDLRRLMPSEQLEVAMERGSELQLDQVVENLLAAATTLS